MSEMVRTQPNPLLMVGLRDQLAEAVGPASESAELAAGLEANLVRLARDPAAAVWEPSWSESAPFKAALLSQYDVIADVLCAATMRGRGLSGAAVRDGVHAAETFAGLLRKAGVERAAGVLALLRTAGLNVSVANGKLMVGPRGKIADEHRVMVGEWRDVLVQVVSRSDGDDSPRVASRSQRR